MFNYIDEMFEKKVPVNGLVLYKTLSRDDEEMQGLFRQAKPVAIHKKGIDIIMKEKVEEKTIMLIKIHIKGEEREIKASCVVNTCEKLPDEKSYKVELEFMILKPIDIKLIDNYIMENLEKVFKII